MKAHLFKVASIASIAISVVGCKEVFQEKESYTTSQGHDLRKGYSFEGQNSSTIPSSPSAGVVVGESKSCQQEDEVLFNGYCISTELVYIWQHNTNLSSFLSFKNSDQCSSNLVGCPNLGDYSITDKSFSVVREAEGDVVKSLYPLYSLESTEGYQYITTQNDESDLLVNEKNFKNKKVIFYVVPGSSLGNVKLSRFAKVEGLGPWKYQLDYTIQDNYKFDTTLGNVF
jgi:hypothetical protein